jgi:hypothetical protein
MRGLSPTRSVTNLIAIAIIILLVIVAGPA